MAGKQAPMAGRCHAEVRPKKGEFRGARCQRPWTIQCDKCGYRSCKVEAHARHFCPEQGRLEV